MKPGMLLSVRHSSLVNGKVIIWETGVTSSSEDRIGYLQPGEMVIYLERNLCFAKVVSRFGVGWVQEENIEPVVK